MNHFQVLSPCLTNAGARLKTWDVTPVQLHKMLQKRSLVNTDRWVLTLLSCTVFVTSITANFPSVGCNRCSSWTCHFYSLNIEIRRFVDYGAQKGMCKNQNAVSIPVVKALYILKKLHTIATCSTVVELWQLVTCCFPSFKLYMCTL